MSAPTRELPRLHSLLVSRDGELTQITRDDGLFDLFDRAGIVRANHDLLRFGHTDVRHLLDRRGRTIIVHPNGIHQPRRGAPGPQPSAFAADA